MVAVSADSLESHRAFQERAGEFPFPLASDPDLAVARLYGVMREDLKRAGRAIFVIGEDGTILHSIPYYQPGDVSQFLGIFEALGMEG